MWFLQLSTFCVLLFVNCISSQDAYSIPPQKIIVTRKGFCISIPDAPGIQAFVFHGSINKHVEYLDFDVLLSATEPINGEWAVKHENKDFKPGDFINYWIQLRKDDVLYTSKIIHYQIKDILQPLIRNSNFTKETVSSNTAGYLLANEIDTIFGTPERSDDNPPSNRGSNNFSNTAVSSTNPQSLSIDEQIRILFGLNETSHENKVTTKDKPSTTPQPLSIDEQISILFGPNETSHENEVTTKDKSSTTPQPLSIDEQSSILFGPTETSHENEVTTKGKSSTTPQPLSIDEQINILFGPNGTSHENEFTTKDKSLTTPQPLSIDEQINILFKSNGTSHENGVTTKAKSLTSPKPLSIDEQISIFSPNETSHENEVTTKVKSLTTPQSLSIDKLINILFGPNGTSHENGVTPPTQIPTYTFPEQWVSPDD